LSIKLNKFDYDLIEQYYTQNLLQNDFWLFASHGSEVNKPVSGNTDFDSKDVLDKVVFASKYNQQDISFMLPIIPWEQNRVYTQYDDKAVLKNQPFYVVIEPEIESGSYHIFKCLSNNNGVPSTKKPEFNPSIQDGIYQSDDGYIWKYMSLTPFTLFRKFAARGLLPVLRNQEVESIADTGIYNILVENRNQNIGYERITGTVRSVNIKNGITEIFLRDLFSETTQSNPIFQVPNTYSDRSIFISKGGSTNSIGAIELRIRESSVQSGLPFVTVSTPTGFTIEEEDKIEILPRVEIVGDGEGATAIPIFNKDDNTRIESIRMITKGNNYTNAFARVVDPRFFDPSDISKENIRCVVRLIPSPRGGHGSNVLKELNAKHIGLSKTITSINAINIPTAGSYSKFAVVKNPEFEQGFSGNTFDNRIKITLNSFPTDISVGDIVNQGIVSGRVHELDSDTNTIFVVDYEGPYSETFVSNETLQIKNENFVINSIDYSPYQTNTGHVLTITDVTPIERDEERSEQIKIILDF
jgi:hypothetical protein